MTTLLTPDDIRGFEPAAHLDDAAVQLLIDAAEAEIVRYAGAVDSSVVWVAGGQRVIALPRAAASITSIVEHNDRDGSSITLAADDYLIDPGGYLLYRVSTGTNPRWRWHNRVVVTSTPSDQEAIWKGVELDLVRLMISYQPGASSETVGSWTTQLSSNAQWNNDEERAAILDRLIVHGRMLVVGG